MMLIVHIVSLIRSYIMYPCHHYKLYVNEIGSYAIM